MTHTLHFSFQDKRPLEELIADFRTWLGLRFECEGGRYWTNVLGSEFFLATALDNSAPPEFSYYVACRANIGAPQPRRLYLPEMLVLIMQMNYFMDVNEGVVIFDEQVLIAQYERRYMRLYERLSKTEPFQNFGAHLKGVTGNLPDDSWLS